MNQTEATPDFQGWKFPPEKMQNTKKNTTKNNLVKEPSVPQLPRQFRDFRSIFTGNGSTATGLIWDEISRIGESGVFFFQKWISEKKNMCCLWASQLSETSLGWKWTQLKKTTYECKHMGFCPGKKHTLTVWIPMYTDFWWMCLLLCFFVHFWGTKPQRFP